MNSQSIIEGGAPAEFTARDMASAKPAELPAQLAKLKSARRLLLVLGVVSAALLTVVAWSVEDSRVAARRQAEQEERNIVLAIQKEIERAGQTIDLTLQSAVRGMSTSGLAEMDPAIRQAILFDAGGSVGLLGETLITDEKGVSLYRSTANGTKLSLADRPFFQRHLQHDGLGLIVDGPIEARSDGHWLLPFSRRINRVDGTFAGIASAALNLGFFDDLFTKYDIGQSGVILVATKDGVLVGRRPWLSAHIDRDFSRTPLGLRAKMQPTGVVEAVAKFDGVNRIYSYGAVDNLPLVVSVGFATSEIYAEWLHKTLILGGVLVSIAVIGSVLVWALWGEYRRRGNAEAAASRSERRQVKLLENVADHAIYFLDPDGRVASWNPGAEKITGYKADEVLGRSFETFFTQPDIEAGEPARLLAVARVLGRVESEAWRKRKDGSCFWARVALTAIADDDGNLIGFGKTAHDLTAQRVEEAQRLVMIEAAPTGMLIIDEAGLITLSNTQADRIFGYMGGSLVGEVITTLLPEASLDKHPEFYSALAAVDGVAVSLERQYAGRRRDGREVAVEVLLRSVRTSSGSIVVASVFEVTERLRRAADRETAEATERASIAEANARLEKLSRHLAKSRDQARHANEAKSRFLTAITHELRTPLNGILGYAQLLDLEGGLSDGQASRVAAMRSAGEYLLGMINAVLDFSQIESDRIVMHATMTDLAAIGHTCVDLVSPAAQAKGLRLSLMIDPESPASLVVDPTRLQQILVNLLGNAVKFTSVGSVELRLLPNEPETGVRIEVVDTGPGVAVSRRQRLFTEFERLDVDASSSVEGSGLGLAITSRLVDRMGGQVGYQDNPSGGSIFWAEVPSADHQPGEGKSARDVAEQRSCDTDRRILVVDDVAMNREVATAFLRLAGHRVVCAESGQQALQAIEAEEFDVVLMDVRMPGMDGLEATRRIRALPDRRSKLPILAMTAQAFTEQIQRCRDAGMNGHVAKPIRSETLLAAIADVLSAEENGNDKPLLMVCESAEFPVLDEDTFRATAPLLDPSDLLKHLATLIGRGDALVVALRSSDIQADLTSVVEAAHAIGGAAVTFGFVRLGEAARHFESAAETDGTLLAEAAQSLIDATNQTIEELHRLIHETSDESAFAMA